MKIVIVNDPVYEYALGAYRTIGGAERQQWLLARALVTAGWSVTVGVREGLKAEERTTIDGVQFVGIGGDQIFLAWYRFLLSHRPDWWYWRSADHWLGLAVQIAKLCGVRTIFAAAFDADMEPRRALFRRPRWWPLYAWGLAQTDRIFAQHGGQVFNLAPRWRSKAYVVPSLVSKMPVGTPHIHRQGYVAWVGILRKPKRADLLIEIARKTPDTQFVVCGGISNFKSSPEYGQQIVAALHALPNVDFLGLVEPRKAQEVIADAAILLSTADEEGFPNTFLEAWSNGTPVVSLTIDPDEIIQQKQLGIVSRSVECAVADIKALVDSPQWRDEIAVRAQRYVAERHSAEAVTKIFEHAVLNGSTG